MPSRIDHLKVLDKKITDLNDALNYLGKGTDLKELIKIIKFPGWTTPAEFAFAETIIDAMHNHVTSINSLNTKLLKASKLVASKEHKEHAHAEHAHAAK